MSEPLKREINDQERRFYARLKTKCLLGGVDVQRVENTAGAGMPDLSLCWKGVECWAELKVWIPGTGALLRKEQYAWGRRRAQAGGRVFLLVHEPGDKLVYIFKYPHFTVEAYGTQEKYVRLVTPATPEAIYSWHDLEKCLMTILFT